jgi:hypothetical protein
MSSLWLKEGHSCRRHAGSRSVHPRCGEDEHENCPAKDSLGKTLSKDGVREPTQLELEQYGSSVENAIADSDPSGSVHHISHPVTRPQIFNVVYIPDAATRIYNKSSALNDFSFIETFVEEREYAAMEGLHGSIHIVGTRNRNKVGGYKVVMQEWVSTEF